MDNVFFLLVNSRLSLEEKRYWLSTWKDFYLKLALQYFPLKFLSYHYHSSEFQFLIDQKNINLLYSSSFPSIDDKYLLHLTSSNNYLMMTIYRKENSEQIFFTGDIWKNFINCFDILKLIEKLLRNFQEEKNY